MAFEERHRARGQEEEVADTARGRLRFDGGQQVRAELATAMFGHDAKRAQQGCADAILDGDRADRVASLLCQEEMADVLVHVPGGEVARRKYGVDLAEVCCAGGYERWRHFERSMSTSRAQLGRHPIASNKFEIARNGHFHCAIRVTGAGPAQAALLALETAAKPPSYAPARSGLMNFRTPSPALRLR